MTCIAAVVVFCTTYALILPAITMEYSCGKEEHVHVDGCYKLTCGLEQTPGHFHDETCYDEDGKLICGQEEPQSHTHTEACYAPADPTVSKDPICGLEETPGHTHDAVTCYAVPKVLSCGKEEQPAHTHDPAACYTQQTDLTCGQQESAGHTHTDACYTRSLVCGLEESGEHTHSDACYSSVLTCGQTESAGHTHTDACYTTTSVLTCTQPETGGHTHTDACYTLGDMPELICTQEETPGHTHTDACYPAASQPQLICGKEEVKVHKHTDECYTLICVLEEHTHTNECQLKEEPTETTVPSETTAPTDVAASTDGETQPSDGETLPIEEIVVEEEVSADGAVLLEADGATPKEAGNFNSYILNDPSDPDHQPICETVHHISATQQYSTDIKFFYKISKDDLTATGGQFYVDFPADIEVVYGKDYPIESQTVGVGQSGTFKFVQQDGHPRMVITFSEKAIGQVQQGNVEGYMKFVGIVDKNHIDENGDLKIEITDKLKVTVDGDTLKTDMSTVNQYGLTVAKSVSRGTATEATPDANGKVPLHYEITVGTNDKGTPGPINLTDTLNWKEPSGKKGCTITSLTIEKYDKDGNLLNTETQPVTPTEGPNAQGGKDETWKVNNLPKLGPNESYKIKYDYEFSVPYDDNTTIELAHNDIKAESPMDGGRPDEKLEVTGKADDKDIVPPTDEPSLGKTNSLDADGRSVHWTVTYNDNQKSFGGKNQDVVIKDPKFKGSSDFVVTAGGTPLVQGTDYTVDDAGNLTLLKYKDTPSNAKIVITYTTTEDTLNNWSGVEPNKVDNTVSYTGRFGDNTAKSKVEKHGGAVAKAGGPVENDGTKLTIPWSVTITPGSDGIPANTPFTDTVSGAFNQVFETGSLKIEYIDANGTVVGEYTDVQNLSYQDNVGWNQNKMSFSFGENPFPDGQAPESAPGATQIRVSYNTTVGYVSDNGGILSNDTKVGEKPGHADAPYEYVWIQPQKEHDPIRMEGSGLSIPWTVTYQVDSKTKTIDVLEDNLKFAGYGDHYYDPKDGFSLVIMDNNSWPIDMGMCEYTVTYYDEAGNVVPDTADVLTGKRTSFKITFHNKGTSEPYTLPNNGAKIQVKYTTKTETVPTVETTYHNTAKAFNRTVPDKVTFNPNEVTKSVNTEHPDGAHKEDTSNDKITIHWTSDVKSASGKIATPITDSLKKQDGSMNHYFPLGATNLKISALDGNGNFLCDVPEGDYTVSYFYDYQNEAKDGNGDEASGDQKCTYMVVKFNEDKVDEDGAYTIPKGGTTLRLTYDTEASPIPAEDTTYHNQIWALEKTAEAEDEFKPEKPVPKDKTVDPDKKIQHTGNTVRIPWTVLIEKGDTPLKLIEEAIEYNKDNLKDAARHYFDTATLRYEFLDENKQSLGAVTLNPTIKCFTDWKKEDSLYKPVDGTQAADSKNATFMQLVFAEDAFKDAPEGTKYLKLYYDTYNNDLTQEQSNKFKNVVQVSGQQQRAETSTTVVKKSAEENGNWTENGTVDVGKTATGELNRWRIVVGTVEDREYVTITDELPEYVVLDKLEVCPGGNNDGGWFAEYITVDLSSGSFSGENINATYKGLKFEGSYKKDEATGRYVLSVTFRKKDGSKIKAGEGLGLFLTPRVDVENLPDSYRNKPHSFVNSAIVICDGVSTPTNPSTQTWTDGRPDKAVGALSKSRYQEYTPNPNDPTSNIEMDSLLHYRIEINKDGADLEPDSDNFFLFDTLTYNGSKEHCTEVKDVPKDSEFDGYDIRLDTDSHKVAIYKVQMVDGKPVLDADGNLVKGEELDPSLCPMTFDTKQKEDGSVEKIIRVSLPDNTPLIMDYYYKVVPRLVPAKDPGRLSFNFSASNSVIMHLHPGVESSEENVIKNWHAESGGGTSGSSYHALTLKKVDAANNSTFLPGAEFTITEYDGTDWHKVYVDENDHSVQFTTNDAGILEIRSDAAWMKSNTLYKAEESKAPNGYVTPTSPRPFYFYRSSAEGTPLDPDLARGATDLTLSSDVKWVENTSSKTDFNVEKIFKKQDGSPMEGPASVDFDLIQFKSKTPPTNDTDPLVSTRKLQLTIKNSGGADLYTLTQDVVKGTMMRLVVTKVGAKSNSWLNGSAFSPVMPQIRRQITYDKSNPYDWMQESIEFIFPVTSVEKASISFNIGSADDISVRLEPLTRSAVVTRTLDIAGLGPDLVESNRWTIKLNKGEGYKWDSKNPGADINGGNALPSSETIGGVTWYYSYVVQERDSGVSYQVNYSNMDSEGKLIPINLGTIQVVNTMLENPPISLPSTGGIGATVFTLAGLALTGGAGLGLCKTKAKRKRGQSEKE